MRISDWSSDVCSSDLGERDAAWALECVQRLDHGGQLHAVVGGVGRAARQILLAGARADHRAPAAGAGIALARAVGGDLDMGEFLHANACGCAAYQSSRCTYARGSLRVTSASAGVLSQSHARVSAQRLHAPRASTGSAADRKSTR